MKDAVGPMALGVVAVVAWLVLPRLFDIPVYVFPSLDIIIREMVAARSIIFSNFSITLEETLLGLLLGAAGGFLVGVAMAENCTIGKTLLPYVVASNAVPVVAIAPIIVLIVGHGFLAKGLVAAFLCFFPMTVNTYDGLKNYDASYAELFLAFGANRTAFFWKYKIFHLAPYGFVGLKLSATFAVIGAVVAEFVGADRGLGYGMIQASYSLNTPRLFSYLFVACGLGLVMYFVVVIVEKAFFARYGGRWG